MTRPSATLGLSPGRLSGNSVGAERLRHKLRSCAAASASIPNSAATVKKHP